jgi:hypothetical protein
MKTKKWLPFTCTLFLLLGIGMFNQTTAQDTKTRVFYSGDNNGKGGIKIVQIYDNNNEYNTRTNVYLLLTDNTWSKAEVIDGFVENGDVNVNVTHNNVKYNVFVDMTNPDKLVRTASDGTKRIYWIKE